MWSHFWNPLPAKRLGEGVAERRVRDMVSKAFFLLSLKDNASSRRHLILGELFLLCKPDAIKRRRLFLQNQRSEFSNPATKIPSYLQACF
jgi:hypothetical protein